jgi:Amt family ammonium transporter
VPFILLGAGLLWFGWFGFNGASYFAAKGAGFSLLTTTASASAALLTWCLIEWFADGKPTAVGAATGAVAAIPRAAQTIEISRMRIVITPMQND